MSKYVPIKGGCGGQVPVPDRLRNSKYRIWSIHCNGDGRCFKYAALALLLKEQLKNLDKRWVVTKLKNMDHLLDWSGIEWPFSLSQVNKFLSQNPGISLNVYTLKNNSLLPMVLTKKICSRHLDMLYVKSSGLGHFFPMGDLDAVLSSFNNSTKKRQYHCRTCLYNMGTIDRRNEHEKYCQQLDTRTKVRMPTSREKVLKFRRWNYTLKLPVIAFASFSTMQKPIDNEQRKRTLHTETGHCNLADKGQQITHEHHITGCSLLVVHTTLPQEPTLKVFQGPNAVPEFLTEVKKQSDHVVKKIMKINHPPDFNEKACDLLQNSNSCCICHKKFEPSDRVVLEHTHLKPTDNINGWACNVCNLSKRYLRTLPIFVHGFSKFESRLLTKHLKGINVRVLAQKVDCILCMHIGNARLLDSNAFFSKSLDGMCQDLVGVSPDHFKLIKHFFQPKHESELLNYAQFLPYCRDYISSWDKLSETEFPSREQFFDKLNNCHISQKKYFFLHNLFCEENMQDLSQFEHFYLRHSSMVLGDTFIHLRDYLFEHTEIDMATQITLAGHAWQHTLKMADCPITLIESLDLHIFTTLCQKGALTHMAGRHAKANTPTQPSDFDPSKPESHIIHLDHHSMYGLWLMSSLPIGSYRELSRNELASIQLESIDQDAEFGFMFLGSISWPWTEHTKLIHLPPCPRLLRVDESHMSSTQKKMYQLMGHTTIKPETKLCGSLYDVDSYYGHSSEFQIYLALGAKIELKRGMTFRQYPVFKSAIQFNMRMRRSTDHKFLQAIWKKITCFAYGIM